MRVIGALIFLLSFSTTAFAANWFVKLYDDKGYTDRSLTVGYKQDIQDMHRIHSDDGKLGFNDKASSVKFRIPSGWQVCLYEDKYFANRRYCIKGTGEEKDVGYFNDKTSSLKWERR